jgi:hypothetical protein
MPIYPHRIRLRGPWERDERADGVRLRRRFNRPTDLDPHEQVWLVARCPVAFRGAKLNDVPLPAAGQEAEWDITPRLADHNLLAFDLDADVARDLPPGPPGEIYLEIRSTWQPGMY